MKNLLLKSKRRLLFAFVTAIALVGFTTSLQAQTITENFEEAAWTSVTTSALASTVIITGYNGGTNATLNTGSWRYSSGYMVTNNAANSKTYTVKSGTYAYHNGNSSNAYIMTPLLPNGVTSIKFWIRTASTTGGAAVYVATNTTITNCTGSMSSTGTVAWYTSFGSTVNSTVGWTSQSIAITGAATSAPCYLKFQRISNEYTLDDIEITTPTVGTKLSTPSVAAGPTTATNQGFTAQWASVSNASSYTVKVYQGASEVVGARKTGETGTSVAITGLSANTSYTYKVTAIGNGSTYLDSDESAASSAIRTLNTAKLITAFTIAGIPADINDGAGTITAEVPASTNITSLTPTVTVSQYADYSPKTAQDFSAPKEYTVTAEDGGTKVYTVTITKAAVSSACDITDFSITGQISSDISGTAITVVMPYGTNVASLTPTVEVSPAATYGPSGAQDFTSPVEYTVTAEDATTEQVYTVTVNIATPSITACAGPFSFSTNANVASVAQTCSVSGGNLVDNIAVSVDAPFQVSNNNSTWGTTTSITKSGFTASGTLYVRYYPTSGDCSDDATVTLSATGATNQTFSVSGTASTAITAQSGTVSYAQDATPADLSVTATGLGTLTYQWYSNTTASNSGGTIIDGQTNATYTPSTATLGTFYYYCVVGSTCGSVTSAVMTVNIVQYAVGDYGSLGSANWGTTNANWRQWDGSGWNTVPAGAPGTGNNVFILSGHVVNLEASSKNCKNLTVMGTLKSSTVVNSPYYVNVYGNIIVTSTGVMGDVANPTGNSASGLCISTYGTGTQTISGGGFISVSRLRLNTANEVVVATDMTVTYHGTSNTGNASSIYPMQTGSTFTINAGKTVTLDRWSSIYLSTGSTALQAYDFTLNVYGTLDMLPGSPTDVNDKTLGKSYFMMNVGTGKTFTLNVKNGGTMTVNEFFPSVNTNYANGTANAAAVGTSVVTVDAGGVLNVRLTADLSQNATQTITGGGTVNILDGATLKVAATAGANGPIQTTTANLSDSGNYSFSGAAAQVTGAILPATLANLTNTNTTGLELSGNAEVTGTLTNSGKLIFVSDDSKTTQIKAAAVNNTGTVVLRKTITPASGWVFISFPFNVPAANIFIGGTSTPATWGDLTDTDKDFYVAEYDAASRAAGNFNATSSPNWINVAAKEFVANKGYIIAVGSTKVLDFVSPSSTSTMFAATADVPVAKHTSAIISNKDWNLVGIPFSSAFDLIQATQEHAPFYCFNGTTYVSVMENDNYQAYPFSAFFLQAYGVSDFLSFASAGRLLKSASIPSFDEIGLIVKNAKYSDKTRIRLQDGALAGYELGKDAMKFFSPKAGVPQICSKAGKLDLSVNTVPATTTRVEVSVTIGEDGTYTISLEDAAKAAGCQQVILLDGEVETDLLVEENYSFAGTAGSTKNLSVLLVAEGTSAVGTAQGSSILVQTIGDKAIITGLEGTATVSVYDVAGKLVQRFTNVNNNDALTLSNAGINVIDVKTATQIGKAKVSVKK